MAAVGMGIPMGMGMGMGMGTVVNPHGPVAILWRFSNWCEIKRKRVKHAINVVVAVWISPNTVQFAICISGIFLHYRYWIHIDLIRTNWIIIFIHHALLYIHCRQYACSTNSKNMHLTKRQGCRFGDSADMGILVGIPTSFSLGMGWNPHGSPAVYWSSKFFCRNIFAKLTSFRKSFSCDIVK